MFKDAGLQPPTTWEEMVAARQEADQPAKSTYGMALAGGSYTENVHFAFIYGRQNGGEWFDSRRQADVHQ